VIELFWWGFYLNLAPFFTWTRRPSLLNYGKLPGGNYEQFSTMMKFLENSNFFNGFFNTFKIKQN
jgi:hypothetical protein